MVINAGPEDHILILPIDMVLIICSLLLEECFQNFKHFFLTWVPYQTQQQISILLHNLDWTNMHVHERNWWLQPNQSFLAFLRMCKDRRVNHALCYDATNNLLLDNMPEENLFVLQNIASQHSPSFVAFHVFRSIYLAETAEFSATSLLRRLRDQHFRREFEGCVQMLRNRRLQQEMFLGWEETPALIPPDAPLCSFGLSTSPLHFYVRGWPPTYEKIFVVPVQSVC